MINMNIKFRQNLMIAKKNCEPEPFHGMLKRGCPDHVTTIAIIEKEDISLQANLIWVVTICVSQYFVPWAHCIIYFYKA